MSVMEGMARRGRRPLRRQSGFTLFEALVAVTLMGMVLAALGAITAQWMPSWNRGFMRVQRTELFSVALNRLAADLSSAEFVTPNRDAKMPLFEGGQAGVILVRSAIGPNTEPGLEVVRIAEARDNKGVALVRTRTPFVPFGAGEMSAGQLKFTDPVVLLRAPFQVSFSYSKGDGSWADSWQREKELPVAVRFLVRDTSTGRTLAISSAAMIHVNQQAGCTSDGASGSGGEGCASQSKNGDAKGNAGQSNAGRRRADE